MKRREYYWHKVLNGEMKTSASPWYRVKCCCCEENNYMQTESHVCYTNRPSNLGTKVTGKLLYGSKELKEKNIGSIVVMKVTDE